MAKINFNKSLKKHGILCLFIFLLFGSFMLLNATSGLIFSTSELDLTRDKRFTFRPQTLKILEEIKSPITINVYYSPISSQQNLLDSQYAQFVMKTLDRYRSISHNKIKINLLNPEPYSSIEEDAKRYGLTKSENATDENNYYFGAVLTNTKGQKQIIPHFHRLRQNYLENDISRVIAKLSSFNRATIGVLSPDFPVMGNPYQGLKKDKDWTFIKLLKQDYDVVAVPSIVNEIPLKIQTLIVMTTGDIPDLTQYALDQFIMRGGNILFMIDPFSEYLYHHQRISQDSKFTLEKLFNSWAIRYQPNTIIGDSLLAENTSFPDKTYKPYDLWIRVTPPYIHQNSLLTQGVSAISLKTAGILSPLSSKDIKSKILLSSSEKNTTLEARFANLENKNEIKSLLQKHNKQEILALLNSGEFKSAFKDNPLQGLPLSEKMLPFFAYSLAPSSIMVLADTDWLLEDNWAVAMNYPLRNTSDLLPYNNNYDFFLKTIDILTGNQKFMAIGSKKTLDRSKNLRQKIEEFTSHEYTQKYQEALNEFDTLKRKLDTTLEMVNTQEISGSIKTYNTIQNMQRRLQKQEEGIRRLDYRIKQESQDMINIIIIANLCLIPILTLLIIMLIVWLCNHQTRIHAERLLHD